MAGMLALFTLLGWMLGILINLLSDSLPFDRRIERPHCLACTAPRPATAWSAVIAWLTRKRPCEYCGVCMRTRNLAVEILAALAVPALWYLKPAGIQFWPALVIGSVFFLITVIDIEHRLILHLVTTPAAVVFAILGFLNPELGLKRALLGGAFGFILFLLLYLLGTAFSRWAARRNSVPREEVALGFGDVTLATLIGLAVGFPGVIEALIRGILYAGIFSIAFLILMVVRRKYSAFMPIPYGPFLILGAIWVYLQGWTSLGRLFGM
jgi:prepilin signal peptidase PulO-like enzyme (type II secretory pathway)